MVDLLPFRGLRYNLEKLQQEGASLSDVVTPPYDVIDGPMQDALYQRHPANFIRLDLGKQFPADNEEHNIYRRAADDIRQWEANGTLIPEAAPAYYAYAQIWEEDGQTIERKGMIGLLRLEEFESGHVLPHEFTLKGPKADRMQLMQQTLCGLSQVFMIYSDPERHLENLLYEQPAAHHGWAQATGHDGVIHRFRPVTDIRALQELQRLFADKTLLIADGHHRYETALGFAREVRDQIKRQTGQEPAPGSLLSDYGMVFVTNMDDPGLKVYPTHRVLYAWPEGWDQKRFEDTLLAQYDVVQDDPTMEYRPAGKSERLKLRLKPEARPQNLPPLLDTFDAALLSETVFARIFNSSQEELKNRHLLGFYRDEEEVDRLWLNNEAVAGFYLAAPSVKLVHQICESGERMPQKSTYFYPKILSGLVILPFRPYADGLNALSGVKDIQPLPANFQFPEAVFSQRPY